MRVLGLGMAILIAGCAEPYGAAGPTREVSGAPSAHTAKTADVLVDGGAPEARDLGACRGVVIEGRCVFAVAEERTWADADQACRALGARLAVIPTVADQATALGLVPSGARHWVGATDEGHEGDFRWIDGSTLPTHAGAGWFDLPDGKTNENCVVLAHDWSAMPQPFSTHSVTGYGDRECSSKHAFLCEGD